MYGSGHLGGSHLGEDSPSGPPAPALAPAPISPPLSPLLIVGGVALIVFLLCRSLDKQTTGE